MPRRPPTSLLLAMGKNNFLGLVLIVVTLITIQNIFFVPAGAMVELGQRTVDAEKSLAEASIRLDGLTTRYAFVADSLKEKSDSLNTVAVEARTRFRDLDLSYENRSDRLVDSLRIAGEKIISEQIFLLKQSHDSVVVALNGEVDALRADRALLWRRIEVSDSVIGAQAMQIDALDAVVAALGNERDAWRVKAMPSLPKRLMDQTPALLAGALLVSLIR